LRCDLKFEDIAMLVRKFQNSGNQLKQQHQSTMWLQFVNNKW